MKKVLLNSRSLLAFIHDVLAVATTWAFAHLLRFNFDIPPQYVDLMFNTLIFVIPIYGVSFLSFSLYRGTWRFSSLPELKRILMTVFITSIVVAVLLLMFTHYFRVPRSIIILHPLLLILMMGGSRFIYRAMKEHQLYGSYLSSGEPVILLGGGDATITLLRDLAKSKDWQVVSILDDDPKIHGREILGVEVHGSIDILPKVKARFGALHAIIVMPSATHQARRRAMSLANTLGLKVLTVPNIDDLMTGKLSVSSIRPVDVEDLLGRDTVKLDSKGLQHLISNKVVMVTGAGGSIGSELCRQIIKFQPKALLCFDISEFALYRLEQELLSLNQSVALRYLVGDVKNNQRLAAIFKAHQPKLVFHAAAYKHVPMMENDNVIEAFHNNVLGTYELARACQQGKVEKCVLVSTDKAVNPTNIMGATKRLAEMVCQGLHLKNSTEFVMVRFGNVLGSSGSVIPKFREQIKSGGPVTVTHPEITRYFMSIPEAAQLVMQAGLMGQGGEIFVLDMGEPVKIVDLARDMIKLSGFEADDIKIQLTGLRPGEKLFEELLADDEHSLPTPHPKLRIAKARAFDADLLPELLAWIHSLENKNEGEIKKALGGWLQEYTPDTQKSRAKR
jgi:FlaA1/EpsC-like NDP-sugar epimerase